MPTDDPAQIRTTYRPDDVRRALEANPGNAVVAMAPDTMPGGVDGPLRGWPVAVKDLIDVAGLPTCCGSAVLAGAAPASADAEIVARLRAAGALIVAKTHTHEFAYGPTGDVAVQGPCRNPHDPRRITGGSSSGSAALVAGGHVPLAVGTDTGCSVRTPAALCGVVGLKPARGGLPTGGVFPLSETCDCVGLIGSSVAVVATAFASLTGLPLDLSAPLDGLVVGRPADPYWSPNDPAIADGVDHAADALAAAGAAVRDVATPRIAELAATYRVIVGAEAYATHRAWLAERPSDYQPTTRQRLIAAAELTAADYVSAQRDRVRLGDELLDHLSGIDLLLTPTTRLRATPIGADEVFAPDGSTVAVRPALLALTSPVNLLGLPAVSVPAPGVTGLPAGVQLIALRGGEAIVLRVALAIERAHCGLPWTPSGEVDAWHRSPVVGPPRGHRGHRCHR
jgi:aspartyl-tRNA(Asn)/glutamyl-tRNA(Gln) amidotransferase subunit A